MTTVQFFFPSKNISIRSRNDLKQFIQSIFKQEGKKLSHLTYVFCSDEYLLDINRQHLNHDFYTDIITFDLSSTSAITGEIYISTDRVRDNARQLDTLLNEELHRVIFHGALHLCGYRDKTRTEQKEMRKKEDLYLNLYFK
jgi:probable rRNA maturation factor